MNRNFDKKNYIMDIKLFSFKIFIILLEKHRKLFSLFIGSYWISGLFIFGIRLDTYTGHLRPCVRFPTGYSAIYPLDIWANLQIGCPVSGGQISDQLYIRSIPYENPANLFGVKYSVICAQCEHLLGFSPIE